MRFSKLISIAAVAAMSVSMAAVTANAATTDITFDKEFGALTYQGKAGGEKTNYTITSGLTDVINGDKLVINFTINVKEGNTGYFQFRGEGNSNGTAGVNYVFKAGESINAETSSSHLLKDEEGNSSCPADTPIHMEITVPLLDDGKVTDDSTLSCKATYEVDGQIVTQSASGYNNRNAAGSSIKYIQAWCRPQNDSTGSSTESTATISNFKAVIISEDQEPEITPADVYDGYSNNSDLAESDAKGFVAEFTSNETVNSLTWYLKNGEENYKELTEGEIPTLSGDGTYKIGLIVYNFPDDINAEDVSAGYTYGTNTAVE